MKTILRPTGLLLLFLACTGNRTPRTEQIQGGRGAGGSGNAAGASVDGNGGKAGGTLAGGQSMGGIQTGGSPMGGSTGGISTAGTSAMGGVAGQTSGGTGGVNQGGAAAPSVVFVPDPRPVPGSGKIYYVSPGGNDSNSGTAQNQAWKTLDKVNSFSFQAGDSIMLEGGQRFSGTLALRADDVGTAQAPISVTSYGDGRATIDAGPNKGVDVYNAAGIQIFELNIVGGWNADSQNGNDGSGISFFTDINGSKKLVGITIDRVTVSGFKSGGIRIGAWPGDGSNTGFSDVRISNCEIQNNGDSGIGTYGFFNSAGVGWAHSNVRVRGCVVQNNRGVANKGSNSGSGIVLSGIDGGLIEFCVAHHNGDLNNHTGGGPVGIWTWDANNIVIQHNESYQNRSKTLDGGGFDLDGGVTNSVIQYNYSHDNEGPGFLIAQFSGARPMNNLIVRYNVSQNDARSDEHGAFNFWNGNGGNGIKNVYVYNNTVFISNNGQGAAAMHFMSGTSGVRIFNNILIASDGVEILDIVPAQSNMTIAGNAYWTANGAFKFRFGGSTYSSLSAFRQGTGHERHKNADVGLAIDPRLTGVGAGPTLNDAGKLGQLTAYRLTSESELIGRGLPHTDFGQTVAKDLWGTSVPRGAKADVGAHEW